MSTLPAIVERGASLEPVNAPRRTNEDDLNRTPVELEVSGSDADHLEEKLVAVGAFSGVELGGEVGSSPGSSR